MLLLTKELEALLPPLYANEGKGMEALAQVKFFCPWNQWTWFASEANAVLDGGECSLADPRAQDRIDVMFFGLVTGLETELGYWRLSDLEGITGPGGLRIERDLYWSPTPLRHCEGS